MSAKKTAPEKSPEENIYQREKRLKSRKQVYKEGYRKGLFMVNKSQLCEWIMQDDVLVRVNCGGRLNDDTEFVQVIIEGFTVKT